MLQLNNKVKEQRVSILEQQHTDKVDKIKESIDNLKSSRELFKVDFLPKYEVYCKKLWQQVETENVKLEKFLEKNIEHIGQMKKMDNKIAKYKEKLTNCLEYKLFLINVKEHKIKYSFDTKIISNAHEIKIQNRNVELHDLNNLNNLNDDEEKDLSQTDMNWVLNSTEPIFKKESDLVDELQNLELENLNYLIKFNNVLKAKDYTENEYTKYKSNFDIVKANEKIELDKKENYVNRLKDKNNALMRERHLILNPPKSTVKKTKKQEKLEANYGNNMEILKSKVFLIYQKCFFYYSQNISNKYSDVENLNFEEIKKADDISEHLTSLFCFIEKIIIHLDKKHQELKISNETKINFLEEELEKKKKLEKANIKKNLYLEKIKEIKEKMMHKNENIILPIRKIQVRMRLAEKRRAVSISVQMIEENNFLDLLKPFN